MPHCTDKQAGAKRVGADGGDLEDDGKESMLI